MSMKTKLGTLSVVSLLFLGACSSSKSSSSAPTSAPAPTASSASSAAAPAPSSAAPAASSAAAPAASSAAAAPSSAAAAGPTGSDVKATLTIWTYDQMQRDNKIQQTEFNKLYPNVKFNVVFIPQEQFANKLIASATTKSGPDIIWDNPAYTQAFADAGVVYDLSKYWSGYSDAGQFPPSVVNKANDKVYSVQTYSNLNALWYNKTLLDSLGIAVPTTLDELQAAMAKIKAANKIGMEIAGTPGIEGEWISKPFFTDWGVTGYKDLGNPNTEKMFDQVAGWVSKGYIPKGDLSLSQGDGVTKFEGGNVGFFVGGNWLISDAQTKSKFTFGVTGMPSGPNGPGIVYLGGQAEAIGGFSKNPDLAWSFLQTTWLSKEFETATLAFGSIPSRKDAVPTDASQPIEAYAKAVEQGVPISSDTANTLLIGNLWSAVLSGQTSPHAGAATAAQIAKTAK